MPSLPPFRPLREISPLPAAIDAVFHRSSTPSPPHLLRALWIGQGEQHRPRVQGGARYRRGEARSSSQGLEGG